MRAIRDPKCWRRFSGVAGSAAAVTVLICSAGARPDVKIDKGGSEYRFHWAVRTPSDVARHLGDLQGTIDVTGTPFRRDTILLYSSECGVFPHGGPHQIAMDPSWMAAHLDKIKFHMDHNVPDPNFSGLIVIDYEEWDLLWDRTRNAPSDKGPEADDGDYKDDWREYIQTKKANLLKGLNAEQKEEVFRTTYEQAGREFFVATFNRIKELRPKAQVSFFKYPVKIYKSRVETAPGVYGYGDGSYLASRLNDRLDWLWKMEDFISPNIYCLYSSVDNPVAENFENTADQDAQYVRSNVTESIRLAAGKPVIPVICYKYQRGDNPMSDRLLNLVNITNQLCAPANSDAQGVILWGSVETKEQRSELAQYFHDYLAPTAAAFNGGSLGDIDNGGAGPGEGDGPDDGPGDDPFPTFEQFDEAFNAGDMRADLNQDGALNFFDYTAWQNAHTPNNKDGGNGQAKGGGGGGRSAVTIGSPSSGRSVGVTSTSNASRGVRGGPAQTRDGARRARPMTDFTPAQIKAALARARGVKEDGKSKVATADGGK